MHTKIISPILILLALITPISTLACNVTATVELVGTITSQDLSNSSIPGDQYIIKCNDQIVNLGMVNKKYDLHMDNGALFSVIGSSRQMILKQLKQLHIMLNTENSLQPVDI